MKNAISFRLRFCLLLMAVGAFFTGGLSEALAKEKLRVLTTFAPITSLTKNVAGNAAKVEQLLGAGAEPHHFALSPSDLKRIHRADVVIENGLGFEDWLDRALKGAKAVRIDASAGITAEDDGNPHVWLDPILAIKQVENIRDGLSKRDPENAAIYQKNAEAYIARLKAVDAEIRQASAAREDKRLLTEHGAFFYFAKRYGFKVVGIIEEFPGREPSPRVLKELHQLIQQNRVKALFVGPQSSSKVVASLSKSLNVPIVEIDPMEHGDPSAAMYEKTMRANLKNLREALSGTR